jgi:WD40 repeat protein
MRESSALFARQSPRVIATEPQDGGRHGIPSGFPEDSVHKCSRSVVFVLFILTGSASALFAQQRVFAHVQPNRGIATPTADIFFDSAGSISKAPGNMFEGRAFHVATLLSDGRVLITGGHNGVTPLSTAEIYDPGSGTFTQTAGNMHNRRYLHTAVLLSDGKVLVSGGSDGRYYLNKSELFDPSTGNFTEITNNQTIGRGGHIAIRLESGKVLLAGGFDGASYLSNAELYDPTEGTFTATTGAMTVARQNHTATKLQSGKVLITGGRDSSAYLSSAETYDPSANTFSVTGSAMTAERSKHAAALLSDGKVLITGGYNGKFLATAEIYDPASGKFTATTKPMSKARSGHTATSLPNGRALIAAGGTDKEVLGSTEIYNSADGSFAAGPALNAGRNGLAAVALSDGIVFLSGGQSHLPLVFDVNVTASDNVSPNIVFSADSSVGFVPYTGSGVVVVFSTDTGDVLQTIDTGGYPALSTPLPDGKSLAVVSVLGNKIFLIDMPTMKLSKTYTYTNAGFGFGSVLSISPDGRYGYISSTETGEVIKLNISDFTEAGRMKGLQGPTQITLTADGGTMFVVDTVTEELVFADTASLQKKTSLKATESVPGANFTIFNRAVLAKDGLTGVIASRDNNGILGSDTAFIFQVSTGKVLASPSIGSEPGYTGLTPDGKSWVILCEFSLSVLSTTNPGEPKELSTVLGEPIGSANIAFSADSIYAFYASSGNDTVFQHNLNTGAVIARVTTGDDPDVQLDQTSSVALTPNGKVLAALNFMGNDLDLLTKEYVLSSTKFVNSPDRVTGLTVLNTSPISVLVRLEMLNNYGELITGGDTFNPVYVTLDSNRQISKSVTQLFNLDPTKEQVGWIRIHSDGPGVVAYSSIGWFRMTWLDFYYLEQDGAPLFDRPFYDWVIPEIPRSGNGSAELDLVNPNYNQLSYSSFRIASSGAVIEGTSGNIAYPTNRQLTDASAVTDRPLAGQVLLTGGKNVDKVQGSGETYDPGTGGFVKTSGDMTDLRQFHTATSLPDGRVLVAGGYDGTSAVATAETFDPSTITFTATSATMSAARHHHSATLLADGRVLIAGGDATSGVNNTAEAYDTIAGLFAKTPGNMVTGRTRHTATLLLNGKVLIAGGSDGSAGLNSAELFDPSEGTFTSTGTMGTKRDYHTATRLASGKVLIVGGHDGTDYLSSAELYDHTLGTFTSTSGSLTTARRQHTATLLPNGKVLIAGGVNSSGTLDSMELYDPATNAFSTAGVMTTARQEHTAIRLANDKVLLAGGNKASNPLNTADLYDPAQNTLAATGVMAALRTGHAAVLLQSASAGDGYYRLISSGGLTETEFATSGGTMIALNGIDVDRHAGVFRIYAPLFAATDRFKTSLNIINANDDDATVTITLRDSRGEVIGQPITRVLAGGEQLKRDLEALFPNEVTQNQLTGWIQIESTQDRVVGTVSITNYDETFKATFQLSSTPIDRFVFPVAAENVTYRTGIALLNTSDSTATVTVELWGSEGTLDGTIKQTLGPWAESARYLSDYFPGLTDRLTGNIRIKSDIPLHGFGFLHDQDLNFLAAVPAIPLP